MAVSLIGMALGWLRGPPLKAKTVGAPGMESPNGPAKTSVLVTKSKWRVQVEYREGRELWCRQMAEAETYDEWHLAAERLDEIEGHLEWKSSDASPHYDSKLLRERIRQVRQMEAQENMSSLVNWLRGGLQRNFVGTGNTELFEHTHVGTKALIERHHWEMTRLLYDVASCPEDTMSLEKRLAFFTEARHALGKSALLLSGGLGLGMYHLGVVRALHEQNLLPRIISASSFGAVVAAVVSTKTVEELSVMFDKLFEQEGNICACLHQAQQDSTYVKVRRLFSKGHLLDAEKLQEALKSSLGDVTFHEAYERTGRIINITIPGSGAHNHDGPRFLNYLTAPNILLWSAATASCALSEGLSEQIVAKDMKGNIFVYSLNAAASSCAARAQPTAAAAGNQPAREGAARQGQRAYQPWEDCSGQGVHADLPMNRLKELFNVNFFIVSQNTACAVPFVQRCTHHVRRDSSVPSRVSLSLLRRFTSTLGYLLRSEVLHRCEQAISLGLAPKLLKQALNQKYVGDVTIAPAPLEVCRKLLFKSAKNAQRELVRMGERSTWPSISQVRGQCEQEMVLDQCVRHLASQVQRKAQRQANQRTMLTSVFSPTFREQRHTHLDLNQFFSPNLALNMNEGPRQVPELRRGETRSSSSSAPPTRLHTLPPGTFQPTAGHRNLLRLEGSVELHHDDDVQPSPPISSSGEGEDGESCDSENPREEMSNDNLTRPNNLTRPKESSGVFKMFKINPRSAPGGPAALTRPF